MGWITPKTDWTAADRFNVEDYNRLKNNLQYLADLGTELYPSFLIDDMGEDKEKDGHFFAREFNVLEDNLDRINRNTFYQDYGRTVVFADNGYFITWAELNRMEQAMLEMYHIMQAQKTGIRRLPFTLGIQQIGGVL